jgi:hypothetical protein
MTAKHTPGPWVIGPDEEYDPAVCVSGDGFDICTAWSGYFAANANAKLIAAAPDLLEALEQSTKEWIELALSGDCGNWNVDQMSVVTNARAAIAKAKGDPT